MGGTLVCSEGPNVRRCRHCRGKDGAGVFKKASFLGVPGWSSKPVSLRFGEKEWQPWDKDCWQVHGRVEKCTNEEASIGIGAIFEFRVVTVKEGSSQER